MLFLSWRNWQSYQVGLFSDDGAYVSLADSLLQGIPYGTLLIPNEPYPTQFPFVFPFLLVPFRALFPASLDALRLVPVTLNLLTLTLIFWGWNYIGRGLSYRWAIVATALLALSPLTILYSSVLMSEVIFVFFCLCMVTWIEYGFKNPTWWWGIVFGILAVCVAYTRTVGWVFLAAWILYLIWTSRWASLPRIAAGAVTMIVILGSVTFLTTVQPRDLFPQFYLARVPIPRTVATADSPKNDGSFVQGMASQIWFHLDVTDLLPYQSQKMFLSSSARLGVPWMGTLIGVGGLVLLGAGGLAWVRRTGLTALQVVVVPYLITLAIWSWAGARFLYPIQLQLIVCALFGVLVVVRPIAARVPSVFHQRALVNAMIAVGVGIVLLAEVGLSLRAPQGILLPDNPYARAEYIKKYIPLHTVVLSMRATMDYLYIPQQVVHLPQAINTTAELEAYLLRQQIQFIVTPRPGKPSAEQDKLRFGNETAMDELLAPLLEREAVHLDAVHPNMDLAIYSVNQEILAKIH